MKDLWGLRLLLGEHCDGCHSPHHDRHIPCNPRVCHENALSWIFEGGKTEANACNA